MREEHRRRIVENRVLRKISGPKWDKVTREWRRLHNEELYALFFSPYHRPQRPLGRVEV
jgi:hypothetical protein